MIIYDWDHTDNWTATLLWSALSYFSWKFFLVNLGFFSSLVFLLMCACHSLVQHFLLLVEGNFILCVTEAKYIKSSLTSFSPIANLSANHTGCTLVIIPEPEHFPLPPPIILDQVIVSVAWIISVTSWIYVLYASTFPPDNWLC